MNGFRSKSERKIITGAATDLRPTFPRKPGGLAKLCRLRKRDLGRDRGDTSLTIPESPPKIKFFVGFFAKFCDFSRNLAKAKGNDA
jgi:hypothetical protein